MEAKKSWIAYALITTISWGIWGAFIEIPEKAGFPSTLGYAVWALTMLPCAIVALYLVKWKLEYDKKSIFLGSVIGFLGAGGQLFLFQALKDGPAYIVFPVISLFPVVTIFLSIIFLKETTSRKHWIGIVLAIIAIILLSYQPPGETHAKGYLWIIFSIVTFLCWGIQAFVMKFSNDTMKAESIYFYMALTSLLTIPFALWMTDFSKEINYGLKGPYLAALVHILNSVGALTLVYALRYGKAIIVVPLTSLAPLITIVISLIIYSVFPHPLIISGMILAMIAIVILAK